MVGRCVVGGGSRQPLGCGKRPRRCASGPRSHVGASFATMRRIPKGSEPHYLNSPDLMNTRVDVSSAQDLRSTALAMWQLTKPGVSRLVFFTTWFGAALAPGSCAWRDLLFTVLGTWLIVASANTLNMYLEHDVDA